MIIQSFKFNHSLLYSSVSDILIKKKKYSNFLQSSNSSLDILLKVITNVLRITKHDKLREIA